MGADVTGAEVEAALVRGAELMKWAELVGGCVTMGWKAVDCCGAGVGTVGGDKLYPEAALA